MATEQSIMSVIRAVGPCFATAQDRVAFAVHAAFFALGHLLIAFGPDAFAEDAFSSTSDVEVRINSRWNMMGDFYAFMYSKPDGSGPNKVLVKCRRAFDELVVHVQKESAQFHLHLELTIAEFVQDCGGRSSYLARYKNLGRLAEILNREIFDKLHDSPTRRPSSPETDPRDYWPRTGEGVDDVRPQNPHVFSPPYGSQVPPPVPHSSGGSGESVFPGRRRSRSPRRAMQHSDRRDDGEAAGLNVRADDDRASFDFYF